VQGHGAKRKYSGHAANAPDGHVAKVSKAGWHRAGPMHRPAATKPCLLHRLIAADVRQDRSLLLQALRCVPILVQAEISDESMHVCC
jgi:hypothetical protein